jgi:CO/xanthine dehydrogenase FAD-binding subunit
MIPSYLMATSVDEAVAAMAAGARPVAGGTDLVVGARQGKAPLPQSLVGIHRIGELRRIEPLAGGWRIGALVSHAEIVAHPGIAGQCAGLADACAIIGSHATRANGTLGGNIMNASPAMDTGAPLLCHDAVAVLRGPHGERRLGLDELWTAPGRSSAAPDELLVSIEVPDPPGGDRAGDSGTGDGIAGTGIAGTGSAYVRLQYRRQMEIAIVGAAALVTLAHGRVREARVAITALAPTIRRVPAAEAALLGTDAGQAAALEEALARSAQLAAAAALPISDVRGSAAYRRAMAAVVVRRAVGSALTRAAGGHVTVPASDTTFGS